MSEFDPVAFGAAMGAMVKESIAPLLDRIEALEKAAPPDLVAELLATDKMETLIDLQVARSVVDYFEENPVQHGKDGEPGEKGADGRDGADGIGIAGAIIDRSGELTITTTKGEAIKLGVVVGDAGKDGADFSDAEIDFDGERTITIKGKGGEIVKRVPLPLDRGYWGAGFVAEKGDIVTHNGAAWIATDDTKTEPVAGASGWRVFARKGTDGRDGRVVRIPESVKLREPVDGE